MRLFVQLAIAVSLICTLGYANTAKAEFHNYETAYYGGYYPGYQANGSVAVVTHTPSYYALPVAASLPSSWAPLAPPVRNWVIPSRFADVAMNEVVQGPWRHYTLMMNGQPILNINNQTDTLRVSEIFQLNNEDAIILTTQNTQPGCVNRHYLVVAKRSGNMLREIGGCFASYDATITNNSLLVTFSDDFASWGTRSTWRYENSQLNQI